MLYDMILKFQGKRFISEFAPMIKNVLFSLMYDFPIPWAIEEKIRCGLSSSLHFVANDGL